MARKEGNFALYSSLASFCSVEYEEPFVQFWKSAILFERTEPFVQSIRGHYEELLCEIIFTLDH